ncbi:hypothetical protein T439DRAFT_324302 [Meredithblackwellia eburnea MCA 4105]
MLSVVAITALSLSLANLASAQTTTPLAAKRFTYPNIPYMVDTNDGPRGIQTGFNLCNSTTTGQTSRCQTAWVNSISDFCLWGPPDANSTIGEEEGEAVAYCTKASQWGTRQIPAGALTGVQFLRTPNYIQITGFIDQTKVNIATDDTGGELDPHGADQRGNPLGGLLFSNAFGTTTGSANINGTVINQVIEWTNFMGANQFCIKACDPSWSGAAAQCEHIYDRIGCAYNAPSRNQIGTFESCLADNALNPGVYVVNGVTSTYSQPPESLGPITTVPYTAVPPSSSSCTPYSSNALYITQSSTSSAPSSSPSSAVSTGSSRASSGASSSHASSGASASASASARSSATHTKVSGGALLAVGVAALFFVAH